MGWEERKGRKYISHKTRIGLRVQSFYLGYSIQMFKIYAVMEGRRREEEINPTMVEDEKNKDIELDAYHEFVKQLANVVLVLNGYHIHRGDLGVGHD